MSAIIITAAGVSGGENEVFGDAAWLKNPLKCSFHRHSFLAWSGVTYPHCTSGVLALAVLAHRHPVSNLPAQKCFSFPLWHLYHWTGKSKRVASRGRHRQILISYCDHSHWWRFMSNLHTISGVAALNNIANQARLSLLSLRAPEWPLNLAQPPFLFESRWRDEDTRDMSLISRGVLTTPPFGPLVW